MKCENCSREATVHLSETIDGRRAEVHLCGACARQSGLLPVETGPGPLLETIVDNLIQRHVGELVGELARTACPICGLSFMDYRTDGRLGCPNDYGVFARGLPPILRKLHGATRHVGKSPRRGAGGGATRLLLRAELRQAIAAEDYEKAARLRDRLRDEGRDA